MTFEKLNAVHYIIRNKMIELLISFFIIDNNIIIKF